MPATLPRPRRPRSTIRGLRLCALLAAAVALGAGAASAQDLNTRVERLQQELKTLQRAVYGSPGGNVAGGATAAGRPQTARLELRLSQLENQIRTLTGKVEELTFKVDRVGKRLDGLAADVDRRLARLEAGGAAMAGQTTLPPSGQQAAAAPQGDLRQPSLGALPQGQATGGQAPGGQAQPTYDSGPKVLGTVPAENLEAVRKQAVEQGAAVPSTTPAQTTAPQTAARQFSTPQEQYDYAFGLLSQANYSEAERALASFLQAYPDDPLAGNAKYWLGETHYVRGQYRDAAVTFAEGYQNYPDSSKAPDNLLKLGKSLSALGQTDDACGTLDELLKRYGDAAANIIQQAQRERQRLSCR